MKIEKFLTFAFVLLISVTFVNAQNYVISETKTFTPQNRNVLLLQDTGIVGRKIILFRTTLRVNTDGSPMSYHPLDPFGEDKALNNVCNAIAVRKGTSNENLCLIRGSGFREAIGVFKQWRDNNWTIPQGYQITWKQVLPVVTENGKEVPCIFKTGKYRGYFGSLTALTNGLPEGQRGECDVDNQINPLQIPALVLVGGTNPVKDFGAKVGDLIVAFNPRTNLAAFAVIGDTGPKDNLGEGSVALNMKLRGTTTLPTNKAETFALNIEGKGVLVAIIPASSAYQSQKPFTAENITERIKKWQTEAGFATPEKFVEMMKSFQSNL